MTWVTAFIREDLVVALDEGIVLRVFHSLKSHWLSHAEGGQVEPMLGYLLSTKNRHDQ